MRSSRKHIFFILFLLLISITLIQSNINAEEPPKITIDTPKDTIFVNEGIEIKIMLSHAPNGLSGYNISISVSNPSIAKIIQLIPPEWAALQINGSISETSVWIKAVDLYEKIVPGSENITLASIILEGISKGIPYQFRRQVLR